jgi:hypothetical protein
VEKMLKMTDAEKAKHDDVILKKPDEVSFTAIRVWDHPDSINLDANGKVKGKENITTYFVAPDGPSVPEVLFLSLPYLHRLTPVLAQEECH